MSVPSSWHGTAAKLAGDVLTPLAIVGVGYWVSRLTKGLEARQWADQKMTEKRLAVYDQAAPLVNDLYCYFMWFGNWKEQSPPQVIDHKRRLDKIVYVNAFLFSKAYVETYDAFMDACFLTFDDVDADAKLKTAIESGDGNRRKHFRGFKRTVTGKAWKRSWDDMFAKEWERSSLDEVEASYEALMASFAEELTAASQAPNRHAKRDPWRRRMRSYLARLIPRGRQPSATGTEPAKPHAQDAQAQT